jgi:hypothetical protein
MSFEGVVTPKMHRLPCALNSFRCGTRSHVVAAGFTQPRAPRPQITRRYELRRCPRRRARQGLRRAFRELGFVIFERRPQKLSDSCAPRTPRSSARCSRDKPGSRPGGMGREPGVIDAIPLTTGVREETVSGHFSPVGLKASLESALKPRLCIGTLLAPRSPAPVAPGRR